MRNKSFINVDGILRIKVHYARQCSTWAWQEAIPSKKSWFFFKTEELPAGWTTNGYFIKRLKTEEVLSSNARLYHNREVSHENSIWEKPWVEIEQMGGKYTNTDYIRFATNEEADEYAKLLASSLTTVEVVYDGK